MKLESKGPDDLVPGVRMNPKYLKLAAKLLELAAIEFGTHGCNDIDERFFEGWTEEERRKLDIDYEAYNSAGEHYNPRFLTIPDYGLMGFFADMLNGVREEDSLASDNENTK